MAQQVSLVMAFLAGLFTFLSPCILPLIPAYISFITGVSIDDLVSSSEQKNKLTGRIFLEMVLFIIGFSLVFILLGASASYFGKFVLSHLKLLRIVGGILVIVFGLYIAGLFKIRFLGYERKIHLKMKPTNILGSFIVGIVFALGWTPCVGPILGTILTYASTRETVREGIFLLGSYSLGLAIPFLISGLAVNFFVRGFRKIRKYSRLISVVTGGLLILFGILILTGKFQFIM
ncbi:cytochrome c biogenesis protein CcdA [bacterium]|nr:cytochrome c biogenesis protein CcdA [bacterium]NIN92070.1 cytochrome c biogenesis protein CcdA [bacterium]NIO18283.1 cytochrome c biogenesis protein CcdA [bacterium]NIO73257.1 cytochrome c biogenesis protein CcdA [bacterium]